MDNTRNSGDSQPAKSNFNNKLNRDLLNMTPGLSAHADNLMLGNAMAQGFDSSFLQDQSLANQFNAIFVNLNMAQSVDTGLSFDQSKKYYMQAIKVADDIDQNKVMQCKTQVEQDLAANPNAPNAKSLQKELIDLTVLQQAPSFARADMAMAMVKAHKPAVDSNLLFMEAAKINPNILNDPNFQRAYQETYNYVGQSIPQGYPYFAGGAGSQQVARPVAQNPYEPAASTQAPPESNSPVRPPLAGGPQNGEAGAVARPPYNRNQQAGSEASRPVQDAPQLPGAANGSATVQIPVTPLDMANQAMQQFDKTGKLTPEIQQQFVNAYKQSLAAHSPALPALMQELQQAGAKLQSDITPAVAQKLGQIDAHVQQVASQYPQNEVLALSALYKKLAQAPDLKAANQIQNEMVQMAPAMKPYLEQRAAVMQPINNDLFAKNKLVLQIEEQANAPSLIALEYAQVLSKAGDSAQAQQYSLLALQRNIDPALSQNMAQFAQKLGVPANEISAVLAKQSQQGRPMPPEAPQAPQAGAAGSEAQAGQAPQAGAAGSEAQAGQPPQAGAAGSEAQAGQAPQAGAAGSEAQAGQPTQAASAGSEAQAGQAPQAGAASSEAQAGQQTQAGAAGSDNVLINNLSNITTELGKAQSGFQAVANKQDGIKQFGPEFEKAIKDSDANYTQTYNQIKANDTDLENQLKALNNDTKYVAQVNSLKNAFDADVKALTGEDKKQYDILQNPNATEAQKAAARKYLEQHDPKLIKDYEAYLNGIKKLLDIEQKLKENQALLNEAQAKRFDTRLAYANALSQANQNTQAKAQFIQAFGTIPKSDWSQVEQVPAISKLAQKLGVTENDIAKQAPNDSTPVANTAGSSSAGSDTTNSPVVSPNDKKFLSFINDQVNISNLTQELLAAQKANDSKKVDSLAAQIQKLQKTSTNDFLGITNPGATVKNFVDNFENKLDQSKVNSEISTLEDALKTGKLNGQDLTSQDKLKIHGDIAQLLNQSTLPIQIIQLALPNLIAEKQYKSAAELQQLAISISDKLPSAELKSEMSLLQKAEEDPNNSMNLAQLKAYSQNIQSLYNSPIELRKSLAQYYLGSVLPVEKGQTNDLAGIFKPQDALNVISQIKAKEKELNGVDLDKNPNYDPKVNALAKLAISNLPPALQKQYEHSNDNYYKAIATGAAAIVAAGTIGVLTHNAEWIDNLLPGAADAAAKDAAETAIADGLAKQGVRLGTKALIYGTGAGIAVGAQYGIDHALGDHETIGGAAVYGLSGLAGLETFMHGGEIAQKAFFRGKLATSDLLEALDKKGIVNIESLNKVLPRPLQLAGVDSSVSLSELDGLAKMSKTLDAGTSVGEISNKLGLAKKAVRALPDTESLKAVDIPESMKANLYKQNIKTVGELKQYIKDSSQYLTSSALKGIDRSVTLGSIDSAFGANSEQRIQLFKSALNGSPKNIEGVLAANPDKNISIADYNASGRIVKGYDTVPYIRGVSQQASIGQLDVVNRLAKLFNDTDNQTVSDLLGRVQNLQKLAEDKAFTDTTQLADIPNLDSKLVNNLAKDNIHTIGELKNQFDFKWIEQQISDNIKPTTRLKNITAVFKDGPAARAERQAELAAKASEADKAVGPKPEKGFTDKLKWQAKKVSYSFRRGLSDAASSATDTAKSVTYSVSHPGETLANAGGSTLDKAYSLGSKLKAAPGSLFDVVKNSNPFKSMSFDNNLTNYAVRTQEIMSNSVGASMGIAAYTLPTNIYSQYIPGEINDATGKPYTLGEVLSSSLDKSAQDGFMLGWLLKSPEALKYQDADAAWYKKLFSTVGSSVGSLRTVNPGSLASTIEWGLVLSSPNVVQTRLKARDLQNRQNQLAQESQAPLTNANIAQQIDEQLQQDAQNASDPNGQSSN